MTPLYSQALLAYVGLTVVTVIAVTRRTAPYGRHLQEPARWGPTVSSRLGWVLMESPSSITFVAVFSFGTHAGELVPRILCGLWLLHYLPRAFLYPALMRTPQAPMPLMVAALGACFNLFNASLNAWAVSDVLDFPAAWLADPRFLGGVLVFVAGFVINQHADAVLRALRKPGETGYKIPYGGLYEYVTCPNYLGEALTWLGFAIATWSPAGLLFFAYTLANLGPRAAANHRWYLERFPDYPRRRRALIPGIW